MGMVCVCFGLRIGECLALRWSDVHWLNGTLRIERGFVEQNVGDVKTDGSRKSLTIADGFWNIGRRGNITRGSIPARTGRSQTLLSWAVYRIHIRQYGGSYSELLMLRESGVLARTRSDTHTAHG